MQNCLINRRRAKCLICKSAWKIILKLATLNSSTCFNIKRLREEHDEALNAAKDNGTKETIEELDKLSQNPEDKMYLLQLILLVILDL